MGSDIYCILLNIAEGVGFGLQDSLSNGIILNVSLNGVQFEVEGNFKQPNVITFNSNCIWECEMTDLKRIKTDNRPVKLECFLNNDCITTGSTNHIGSLLLPLRGVKIINSFSNLQVKGCWYKLNNLSSNCRQSTPQLYLMLSVIKKTIVNRINLEAFLENHKSPLSENNTTILSPNVTHTQNMLHSQQGIFIKLHEDVGQIQVGNDPLVDCDIFFVTLTFRQIKSLLSLLSVSQTQTNKEINTKSFVFQYDFLGSISNKEILLNINDCFTVNEKISICFRSSLKNLRLYFQHVFYIPINLYYMSETAIAEFNFDISSFLPDDIQYFNDKDHNLWTKHGSFRLDILKKISPRIVQPSVEFLLTLELLTKDDLKEKQCNISPSTQQLSCTSRHEDVTSQEVQFEQEESFLAKNKVAEYLSFQQSVFEERSLKPFYSDVCKESDRHYTPAKDVREVAVNTDENFEAQETVQTKQMYIQDLQARREDRKSLLMACLETKIIKCDQLLSQLKNTQAQLNALVSISLKNASIAKNASGEIESSYISKIQQLETEIQRLKMKDQQQEIEKTLLKKRNEHLENHLKLYQRSYLAPDQLQDVLNEMRSQADRFTAIENFYREQWLNYMHVLEINIFKILDDGKLLKNSDVNFYVDEIFNGKINNVKINKKPFQFSTVSLFNSSSSDNDPCL